MFLRVVGLASVKPRSGVGKDRDERLRRKAGETAVEALMAMTALVDLMLWAAENGVKVYDSSPRDGLVSEAISTKRFEEVFELEAEAFTSMDEVYGDVWIDVWRDKEVVFYRGVKPEAPIVVTVRDGRVPYLFPPRDLRSVLFFLLNPKVCEEAAELLQIVEVDPEVVARFIDYHVFLTKLPKNLSDVEIEHEKPDVRVNVGTTVRFYNDLKAIYSIEAIMEEYDEVFYDIALRVGDAYVTYTLRRDDKVKALQVLLEEFASERDVTAFNRIMRNVKDASLKTYLVVKAFERLRKIEEKEDESEEDTNT